MDIPTVETERLRLVPPAAQHFAAFAALVADAVFMESLEMKPMDRNQADRAFCAMLGHWHLRGWGNFIVEERATGAFVGRVGINDWEEWPEPELGWWTAPAAWGKGYAPEAARAVLDFVRPRRKRLISLIRAANARSIRVAEKLGATHEKDIEFLGSAARVYVHLL
jgi:RimJ/RimL family protein N-acetyltransferase